MSEYRKTYPGTLYFVTLTVTGWLDVFNRPVYNDEIIKNLAYCQEKEGPEIYSYVLMSSHLHMVAMRKGENNLTELLGRFKSATAKKILKLIEDNPGESRKEWMMYMVRHFARTTTNSANIISGSTQTIRRNYTVTPSLTRKLTISTTIP